MVKPEQRRAARTLSTSLRIVLKELNETAVWLLIAKSPLVRPEKISAIVAENEELCRIIGASVRTARNSESAI
jgi:four helix bundle protein